MSSTFDFDFFSIQTHVLKVHVNCEGCEQKVKKILRKIQGVYSVNVEAEEEKITVIGNVEFATLIRKLARAGKHAEPWSPSSDQQMINTNRDPRRNKHHRQPPPNMIGSEGLNCEFDPIFVGGNGNAIGADGNVFSVMGNNASFRGNGGLGFAEFPDSHSHHHHTNYASPPPFMVPTNTEAFYGVQFAPTWNPQSEHYGGNSDTNTEA
ncbi:hypothetical protein COP2_037417 [Malus domestica]